MASNTFTTRDLRLRGRHSEQVCVCVQWAKQPKTTTGHKGGNGAQRVTHKQRTQQCNTCSKPSTMATTTTTTLGGGQCVVVCVMAMPHMPHVPQQWVAAGGVWWCGVVPWGRCVVAQAVLVVVVGCVPHGQPAKRVAHHAKHLLKHRVVVAGLERCLVEPTGLGCLRPGVRTSTCA